MHVPTPVLFDNKAREKILRGVFWIYEAVRRTMGPQGGNALIYGLYSRPYRLTNDGYTVAEIIELKDPHEQLAANAIQDASKRTNLLAGDGTTATTVIAGKLVNTILPEISEQTQTVGYDKAFSAKKKGLGVMDIKKALFRTRDLVIQKLKDVSKEIKSLEDLIKIATISVENEEYGKTIAEMAWKVGTGGYIDVVEGFGGKIETELIEGARWPAKIPAKAFVNKPERYEMEVTDGEVILTNYTVDLKFMQTVTERVGGFEKLIIFAPEFKNDVLVSYANFNKKNSNWLINPVKVPSLKTVQFEDVAVITGAKFINKDQGDKPGLVTKADVGFLSKLVVKDTDVREDCVAIGGKGTRKPVDAEAIETPVEARLKVLKEQLEATRDEGQKNLLRRRIAGLASAVGVIRVSCDSEAETYYWKKKIEDAVYACKAALEEGYVPGGGMALKTIAEELPDDDFLKPALLAPYEQIGENMEEKDFTVDENVIDPTKAIRYAVEHAVSVAANLATVKIIIPESREITPGDGYVEIAKAIKMFNLLWAKRENVDLENIEEIARDEAAQHDAIIRSVIE